MPLIDDLLASSNNIEELSNFINNNSTQIYDFFISQSYNSILKHKSKIELYILPYYKVYKKLDFSSIKNNTFILSLLDVSERFGFQSEFQTLYKLCKKEDIDISSRLEASSKFLFGIRKISDYSNRMSEILDLLAISFLKEEDRDEKVIATLIHYYTEVLQNFGDENLNAVSEFRELLFEELSTDYRKFLINYTVEEILNEKIENVEFAYESIHQRLDSLLNRSDELLLFETRSYLIESNTEYSLMLDSIKSNFLEIRDLCASLYAKIASDEIFWSLQRGVKILTEQNQLLAYINSYGKMHHSEVMSAFEFLPNDIFTSNIEIYDWGCGQGLASVCFIEYLNINIGNININSVTLIEPSEIALKRAALHVRKFNKETEIVTLNKDLDSIKEQDFETNNSVTKIQLFSNILDIDRFSMTDFILNIKKTFKGFNYFCCVSPYVSEYKTQRLNDFVEAFNDYDDFELIISITQTKGEWKGTSWSRVIRVFKANL